MVDKTTEVTDEFSDDALDEWYDGIEEDDGIDQPAAIDAEPAEEPSTPVAEAETAPGEEVQTPNPEAQAEGEGDGTQSAPPPVVDPNAWIEQLDPEVRRQAEALVRRDQSNSGRVAALQSRLDEQNAEQEARRIARTNVRPAGTSGGTETEQELPQKLKEFTEEFPNVADSMKEMMAMERQRYEEQLAPLKEQQAKEVVQREQYTLRQGVAHLFNTAETGLQLEDILQSQSWRNWLEVQPREYQEFVRTSKSAEAALTALESFARHEEAIAYQQWVDAGMPGQEVEQQETTDADRLAARRGDALKGTSPDSRSAEVSSSKDNGSYEALFDEAVAGG